MPNYCAQAVTDSDPKQMPAPLGGIFRILLNDHWANFITEAESNNWSEMTMDTLMIVSAQQYVRHGTYARADRPRPSSTLLQLQRLGWVIIDGGRNLVYPTAYFCSMAEEIIRTYAIKHATSNSPADLGAV